MKVLASTDLFCQVAGRDAEYHLRLLADGDAHSVEASWGRRGSKLQTGWKCQNTSFDRAQREYDKQYRKLWGEGYRPSSIEAPSVFSPPRPKPEPTLTLPLEPEPATRQASGFLPELLTPITMVEATRYMLNDNYWFQPKRDGKRMAVWKRKHQTVALNKKGEVVACQQKLIVALFDMAETFLIDGEWEHNGHAYFWDIFEVDGLDLRAKDYEARYKLLVSLMQKVRSPMVHVVPTAQTTAEKKALVKSLDASNEEGFVVKRKTAPYRPGRAGQHFKFKFRTETCVIVGPKPKDDEHRSVGMWMLNDKGKLVCVGTVGVPSKYPLPASKSVIEVRYRNCTKDQKLTEAKYFGKVRDDVDPSECSFEQQQVRWKPDARSRKAA